MREEAPLSVFPERRILAMGLFTKDIKTMNELFVHQPRDIYYAEQQLVKALQKMATDPHLKQGFLTYQDVTRTHVQRLEQVFQMCGAEVKAIDRPETGLAGRRQGQPAGGELALLDIEAKRRADARAAFSH